MVALLETSLEFTKRQLDPPDLCEETLFRKPQETKHVGGPHWRATFLWHYFFLCCAFQMYPISPKHQDLYMPVVCPESKGHQLLSVFLTLWVCKLTTAWWSQRCAFCTFSEADSYLFFLYLIPLWDTGKCFWVILCPFLLILGSLPCSLSSCQSFYSFRWHFDLVSALLKFGFALSF